MERPTNAAHVSDPIMRAREEGKESYHAQSDPSDNPYTRYTDPYFAWLRGWHTEASMRMLNKAR